MMRLAFPVVTIVATYFAVSGEAKSQEICICGYNPQTYCDGALEHYVSECYDENLDFCGIDDQVIGECDAPTALKSDKGKSGNYVIQKPKLPKALLKRMRPFVKK